MDSEKLNTARELLESGHIKTFKHLFKYIPRSGVAKEMGINYTRFSALVNDPIQLRYSEVYEIAALINVSGRIIDQIIINQIEELRMVKEQRTAKKPPRKP